MYYLIGSTYFQPNIWEKSLALPRTSSSRYAKLNLSMPSPAAPPYTDYTAGTAYTANTALTAYSTYTYYTSYTA